MAETFPQEGLDRLLQINAGGSYTSAPTVLWLGLFVSQSATTVIAPTAGMSIVTEPSGYAYVRATILATFWGAATFYASGRIVTASQIAFPTAGGVWGSVNGFFLTPTSGLAAAPILYQANFDDNSQLPIATYDRVQVAPSIKFSY